MESPSPSIIYAGWAHKIGVGKPALKSSSLKKNTRAQPIFGNNAAGIFRSKMTPTILHSKKKMTSTIHGTRRLA
jgi:hypothetical protein